MFDITKKIEIDSNNLVSLRAVKRISDTDREYHKEWNWLGSQYVSVENIGESIHKACLSVINAILYQRRIVFCLTRDGMRSLVKNDKNFLSDVGWSDSYYPKVIGFLKRSGIIEQIKYEGFNSRKPPMYEVKTDDLLCFFKAVDRNEQYNQSFDFVNYGDKETLPKTISQKFRRVIEANADKNYPEVKEELDKLQEHAEKLYHIADAKSAEENSTEEECAKLWDDHAEAINEFDKKWNKHLAREYYNNLHYYGFKKREKYGKDQEIQ